MEGLAIGKPAINIYMSLQGYPLEGEKFLIKNKIETLGNVSATSTCLLNKWGVNTHFTGVIGGDPEGEKVKKIFTEANVDCRYVEVAYQSQTSINYMILNNKTGVSSQVLFNKDEAYLTRYKYDFVPDFMIIDGTERAGSLAVLNNIKNATTFYYGNHIDNDSLNMSKRCSYVICNQKFAEAMAKFQPDGSNASYVDLYQHIVDASGNNNYIVILDNHKILYSVKSQVKMLPEMKMSAVDYSSFDSVFMGAFIYAFVNGMDMDDSVKIANTAAGSSLSKVGEANSIPELDDVLSNSGLKEKFDGIKNGTIVAESNIAPVTPLEPTTEVVDVNQTAAVVDSGNPELMARSEIQEAPAVNAFDIAPDTQVQQVAEPVQQMPVQQAPVQPVAEPVQQVPVQQAPVQPVVESVQQAPVQETYTNQVNTMNTQVVQDNNMGSNV